jgi:hypothetical protein
VNRVKFAICTVSLAQLRRLPTANWAEFNMGNTVFAGRLDEGG